MAVRELGRRDDRGQAYVAFLVIVLVVTCVAVWFLTRTLIQARAINDKASVIATTGRGINASTDAIIQLDQTNSLGKSINETAQPLVGQLNTVIGLAQAIDNKATTITASALTINGTAKTIGNSGSSINNSARGIERNTSAIVPISSSIKAGVAQINQNVMQTIGIAEAVRADVRTILVDSAATAVRRAACIDNKTSLGAVRDGDCR